MPEMTTESLTTTTTVFGLSSKGKMTIEGCAHRFEVTSIGPMNVHAFFGPQTRDVTEIGLIPSLM